MGRTVSKSVRPHVILTVNTKPEPDPSLEASGRPERDLPGLVAEMKRFAAKLGTSSFLVVIAVNELEQRLNRPNVLGLDEFGLSDCCDSISQLLQISDSPLSGSE